jgi:cell division protein FtsI/penicillin-binding protein 2
MRRPLALAVAGGSLLGVAVLAACANRGGSAAAPPASGEAEVSLSHTEPATALHEGEPREAEPVPLAGLDLLRIVDGDGALAAPAGDGTARLTLDADLQRTAVQLMSVRHLPEAAVVLMDVATGKLLVYASHIEGGPPRDLCAEANAPSASLFKIVTAAALVENAHLGAETRQCYSGGEQRISALDLIEDPQRDRWCATLAGAMGRSINTAFARLARAHLSPQQLESMARRFGYGRAPAFDVAVQPSALRMPTEPLEFARTAAGFWNTTLSPLQAAEISAIVARGGEAVRPSVVERVLSSSGLVLATAPEMPTRRVVARETAEQLSVMMEHTVSEGTCWRAFHDGRGAAFLPGIPVAGKTGTLTDAEAHRFYTWFTGFAPSRAQPGERQVAVAVLVVNGPTWQVKANVVARDVLRAYFAARGAQGVTRPSVSAVARHHKRGS